MFMKHCRVKGFNDMKHVQQCVLASSVLKIRLANKRQCSSFTARIEPINRQLYKNAGFATMN